MPVAVSTPSRLHFGLLRFEQPRGLSYGGLGMMIAEPRWFVQLEPAQHWSGEGEGVERALEFARRVLDGVDAPHKPRALRLQIAQAIPQHRGLGGGTQLGLAVAAGIRQLLKLPAANAMELAVAAGRGLRSAVGTHGFIHGGLIWETGRLPGEPLGRLAARVALPETWRIVLVDTAKQGGLSGKPEVDAFQALPPVPATTTERLQRIAEDVIMPAAQRQSLEKFGQGLYEYGRIAGECFAAVQGGPYASPAIAHAVRAIRQLGIAGAGQSSWGPSVFALTESQQQAEWLRDSLSQTEATEGFAVEITSPDNRGAMIEATST
jgi:beta-RFAP synthase